MGSAVLDDLAESMGNKGKSQSPSLSRFNADPAAAVSGKSAKNAGAAYKSFLESTGFRAPDPTILEFIESGPPEGNGSELWRWRTACFMESDIVRTCVSTVVLANAIMIGIGTAVDTGTDLFQGLEWFFIVIFVLELGLKLYAHMGLFWNDWWNIFDFIIVMFSVVEILITTATGSASTPFSVLRLLRVFRILRMLSISARLGQLVNAFLHALKSVMWVALLMLLFLYIFAVPAVGFFGDTEVGAEAFGSVARSMLTLIQFTTLDDWTPLTRDIEKESPLVWLFVMCWLVLAAVALLNLLTAVFIEALTDSTNKGKEEEHHELMAKRQKLLLVLTDLFHRYDTDGSKTLSSEELHKLFEMFEEPAVKQRFDDAKINIREVKEAITYSDTDCSGEIDYEEFLTGITTMDEAAVKCNTLELQSRVRWLQHNHKIQHIEKLHEVDQMGQNIRKVAEDVKNRMTRKQMAFTAQLQATLKQLD